MENTKEVTKSAYPYAVIKAGGMQYTVRQGDVILLPLMVAESKSTIKIDEVLLVSSAEGALKIGTPNVSGASVTGTVVRQTRGPKVIVYKKKKRKGYTKKQGHRQDLTQVKIDQISA